MKIIWNLLMAVTGVAAMQNPVQNPKVLKYACCPHEFGYQVLENDGDKERIYPCDLNQTRGLDDEVRFIEIRSRLFKCLLVELSFKTTVEAKQAFATLIHRLRIGRIKMTNGQADGGYTQLTHKDFFHRMLAHLPGYLEIDPCIFVREWQVALIFVPCIHNVQSTGYRFATEHEDYIFNAEVERQFESIKPFPSLMALSVRAMSHADRKIAVEYVPQELKPLFY